MAQSPVFTHAFDFYYKWAPTGSSVITNLSWSQHYVSGSGPNKAMSGSWYNFPPFGVPVATGSILTRHTSSITTKDGALAWGSAASDLLWNVLTPSMSFSQALDGAGRADSIYRFTYNSESFLRKEFLPANGFGVLTYPITSSWIAYEPRMIKYASGSTSTGYVVRGTALNVYFPASINNPDTTVYSLPSAYTPPTTTYPRVGKNPTNITYGNNSTGSNDGRFFDLAGGCGITRASISASLVQFAANKSGTSAGQIALCSVALKKRRLFFPTISASGSSLAANNPSSWVRLALGKPSNQFFTENGGIYNVKFTLKRDITYDYYPDETQGSELLVYIHNVNAQVPSPSNRILGKNGWYPPEANIVRIKNTPAMAFENPDTGYKLETFNINVVQYGFPAQLVFEASGSLANDGYFGCIIDDVEFCKVGVTTDPGLIKPLNFVDQNTPELAAAIKGEVAQPPTPLTGEQQALLDQANAAAATAQGFATTAASSAATADTKAGEAASFATTAGNALTAVNIASGSAKTEINSAKDAGVAAINQASGSAKTDITSAKDTAVSNVNTAKDAGVVAINQASGSASQSIAGFVVQAKGFKDEADAAVTYANTEAFNAAASATLAAASASLAKGFATAAQASASVAQASASAASGFATIAAASASLAKGFATAAAASASSAANSAVSSSKFALSGSKFMSQSFAYASQSWSTVKGTTNALYNNTAASGVTAAVTAAASSFASQAGGLPDEEV